jgi:hypothetical protein
MPDIVSYKTLIFNKILPVLKSRTDVQTIWLVYMPDKITLPQQKDPNITILDIHDYKNAVELLKKIQPDLIYGSATPNLPDHALTLAGRFLKVPVIGEILNESLVKTNTIETAISFAVKFFDDSVPTDTIQKKRIMRRGRFFIYKYLFLLKTQIAIKISMLKIIESFFVITKAHLSILKKIYDPYFSCTLHFLESERLIKLLERKGFDRSTLIVTGIPHYDSVFKRVQNLKSSKREDKKIRVLLLTHSLFEHGYQTRAQRDHIVKSVVTEISKHKSEMSLMVKIHPSSESLSDYQSLINPIDSTIPIYKDGDALDFIENSDVVISYSTSSGPMHSLILKKPVIFCNFFNLEGDEILERGLAYDCRDAASLIPAINQVISSNPATKDKLDEFIKDFYYKSDGHATERVCDAIFNLLKI